MVSRPDHSRLNVEDLINECFPMEYFIMDTEVAHQEESWIRKNWTSNILCQSFICIQSRIQPCPPTVWNAVIRVYHCICCLVRLVANMETWPQIIFKVWGNFFWGIVYHYDVSSITGQVLLSLRLAGLTSGN